MCTWPPPCKVQSIADAVWAILAATLVTVPDTTEDRRNLEEAQQCGHEDEPYDNPPARSARRQALQGVRWDMQ
jgi:hypothetical protein